MKEITNIAIFIIQIFMNLICVAFGIACIVSSINSEQTIESDYLVIPVGILLFVYGFNEYVKTMKTFIKE